MDALDELEVPSGGWGWGEQWRGTVITVVPEACEGLEGLCEIDGGPGLITLDDEPGVGVAR